MNDSCLQNHTFAIKTVFTAWSLRRENEVAAMGGRAENTAWSFQPGHISVANKAYRHLPKAQNKNAKWRMERPFDRENWQRYGLTVRLTNLGVETIDQRVATADRRFMYNRCVDLHERVDVPQTTCTREVTFEYRLAVTKKNPHLRMFRRRQNTSRGGNSGRSLLSESK